jgi:hypothetical protein
MTKEEEYDEEKENQEMKKGSDKSFIYATGFIIAFLLLMFVIPKLIPNKTILSLDELHQKNIEGKLPPEKGYLYQGLHSFVRFDNLWYTQIKTPKGTKLFNIPFHYSPNEVGDIEPEGILDYSKLDTNHNFFMTFDPTDENLNYIAVATGESVRPFIDVFGKAVIGSCTKNETDGCLDRPIIECNSTTSPVFYFANEEETRLLYLNNCIILSGTKEELLRVTDRMLFDLLGIMER